MKALLPEKKHEDFQRDCLAGAKDSELAKAYKISDRVANHWRRRLAPDSCWATPANKTGPSDSLSEVAPNEP
jgi:hypothetical protein